MNKLLVFTLVTLVVLVAGGWYWSTRQSDDVLVQTPTTPPSTSTEVPSTHVYKEDILGFSITFPTALALTTNDSLYRVDSTHVYTAMGPGKSIPGVRFTIPRVMTAGTNLSTDSYLSVEHLEKGEACAAVAFIGVPNSKSKTIQEGAVTYSFASSSEAAAGNRYEEYVYALPDSNPCIAVRYVVHYGVIENYATGTINAFNRTKLFDEFDVIRKTLTIRQ